MADASRPLPRVLVVDDEEHITELVAMALGYNGFEVERLSTGRAALEAVERRSTAFTRSTNSSMLNGFVT